MADLHAPPTRGADGYMPLREYAAVGDGRTVALIASDGQIDWLPMPALHTPPVFAGLIDASHGGRFVLRPRGAFSSSRSYVDGTNVLATRFETATGTALVTDALVTGVAGRLPWSELARRIEGIDGEVTFDWVVIPGNVFGTEPIRRLDSLHGPILRAGGINLALVGFEHGRLDPTAPGRGVSAGPRDFHGSFRTEPGSRSLLVLCGTDDEPIHLPDPRIVDEGIDRSIASWQFWSDEFSWDGPWSDAVRRSALALKLLIFSPTGAIAAAATTSLPESLTGDKNYDYRFAWVRDLAYTVDALLNFGLREEPHAAVSWMLTALKNSGGKMRIFFELGGSLSDGVREIAAEGWNGVGRVRVGNVASGQLQLGVYADVLSVLTTYVNGGNILDETTAALLLRFADEACVMWQKKDSGMWELPRKRHYTSSKMACWQAIDSAIRLADAGEIHPTDAQRTRWAKNCELIRDWVDERGWSESLDSYVMYPGSVDVDASVLLHAPSGFDRGERMSRTIDHLRRQLGAGPLLYRYSGMQDVEGTFTACAFWMASALACVGRQDDAVALMDQLVAKINDVGLLSEMIDAADDAFLGNLPQGLSHLAVVNAAITIKEMADQPDS